MLNIEEIYIFIRTEKYLWTSNDLYFIGMHSHKRTFLLWHIREKFKTTSKNIGIYFESQKNTILFSIYDVIYYKEYGFR